MSVRVVDPARLDEGSSTARVARALAAAGIATEIVEFAAGTRTSADAAAAIGCRVAQIAKSIVFRATRSDRAVVVVTSGALRVSEAHVAEAVGEPVGKANAEFVRSKTGFAIGGVAPFGLAPGCLLLVDSCLQDIDPIWAAAGTPSTVFQLRSEQIARIDGVRVVAVSQD